MSFSTQVKEELNAIHIKGNCCKKSYLLGALMYAEVIGSNISLTLSDKSTVDEVIFLLRVIYKIKPEIKEIKKGCFNATALSFDSSRLAEFLLFADTYVDTDSQRKKLLSHFSCQGCKNTFLRSVFCTCGSVSDPRRSYTLEIRVANMSRANLVCSIIEDCGLTVPFTTDRKKAVGLFYRNESSIEDILTACGGNKSIFTFFNAFVEKDLRNTENRATNCVAKNISKTVEAAALQIRAIEALIANGLLDELSAELKVTANLRLNNPDISMTELAQLHTPIISKSGLNHRLSRLIDEAKKKRLI